MAIEAAVLSKEYMKAIELGADLANLNLPAEALTVEQFPLAAGGVTGTALLGAWQKYQDDKKPPKDEEEEAKDVASEEYLAELAATLEGVPTGDAGFIIKALTTAGFYFGGRVVVADIDKSFDLAQGAKSGFGVCLLPNGDVYAGEYADGKREGKGVLKTAAGTTYAGEWLKGKRHGMGAMVYADGGKYMGDWKYGKRHGKGNFMYAGGDSYVGFWHAGQKHGSGAYSAKAAGSVYEGTWQFGVLKASKLVMNEMQGAAYYGAFDKEGRPTGSGAFAFGNGVTLTGTYDAPPVPEAEGDEAPVVAPSTWSSEAMGADVSGFASLTVAKPVINVIIAGAPASGKGTQAEKIVADFGLFHLSTGDLLRAAAADPDNEIGQQAAAIMAEGGLVPDEIMLGLVTQKLEEPGVKEKGWLLDGFPRTAAQAAALEEYFLIPTKAVLIDVPFDVLTKRVTGRRKDPETGTIYHLETKPPLKEDGEPDEEILARLEQRADDTEEALTKRLEAFSANRESVATAFSKILLAVDGNRPPDDVYADVCAFLKA